LQALKRRMGEEKKGGRADLKEVEVYGAVVACSIFLGHRFHRACCISVHSSPTCLCEHLGMMIF
jgi:hypothetical protein